MFSFIKCDLQQTFMYDKEIYRQDFNRECGVNVDSILTV